MSFTSISSNAIQPVGAGEAWDTAGASHVILSETVFEAGLKTGLFAKVDAGSIDNMDGSATPVIAGVILRDLFSVNSSVVYNSIELKNIIRRMTQGLVTVTVLANQTPGVGLPVWAANSGNANDGKALTAVGVSGVATTATFVREIRPVTAGADGVWLIQLK